MSSSPRSIEERLRGLEDRFALYQILSAFAPVIDGGAEAEAANFFTVEGAYIADVPGVEPARGRKAVQAVYESETHRKNIDHGITHMLGFPHVIVDGDRATALCYACIMVREENGVGWRVARIAANSFDFVREAQGWRITQRVSRQLGAQEARDVFAKGRFDLPWLR